MSQQELFNSPKILTLPLIDAEVRYFPSFFPKNMATQFMEELENEITWQQKKIKIFGKELDQPRLTAFYGDKGLSYTYSNLTWEATEWTQPLLLMKQSIEEESKCSFNCVLLNLYRNGEDSMGWHSDDEPELGENPAIASVSFGASRKFSFRHKKNQAQKFDLQLEQGSLLLMQGATQANWHHQLPKTKKVNQSRVNLTFRTIKDISLK